MRLQPSDFALEATTMWSFPERGDWATHSGDYRGNWSPLVPRNLILRYSKPGDWIMDQFLGSGTTLVEAKLLNRNAIGVDINKDAILQAKSNMQFSCDSQSKTYIREGDARNLQFINSNCIDFICTHPPYANIIKYSENLKGDMSLLDVDGFLGEMKKVACESFRVLKNGRMCAVMIGDMRRHGNVIPLGFKVMNCFLESGFFSKEIIIKRQHNCRSTLYWKKRSNNFLMLEHEYIFIFKK